MNLSIDEQKRMLKKVRADSKHLTLAERWQEEDKMNRQLGVFTTNRRRCRKTVTSVRYLMNLRHSI